MEVDIPLGGGLDEKTARKLVPQGFFLDLVNARFDRNQQVAQRYGTTTLSQSIYGGGTLSTARAGHAFQGYPVLVTDDKIYSYSEDQTKWIDRGRVFTPQVSRKPVLQVGPAFAAVSHCAAFGVHVYAIEAPLSGITGSGIYACVVDENSGQFVKTLEPIGASTNGKAPRLFVCGNLAVCVWIDGVRVYASTLDISGAVGSWSARTQLVSDAQTTRPAFNARQIDGHATDFLLIYCSSAPGAACKTARFNSTSLSPAVASLALTEADTDIIGMAIHAKSTDSQYWFSWTIESGTDSVTKYVCTTTNLSAESFAPVTILTKDIATYGTMGRMAIGRVDATHVIVFASPSISWGTSPGLWALSIDTVGTGVLATSTTWWMGLLGEPFTAPATEASRLYIPTQLWSGVQSSNYLCEFDISNTASMPRAKVAARFATRLTGQIATARTEISGYVVPSVVNPSTGKYTLPHNVVVSGSGTGQRVQLWLSTFDFEPATRHRGANYRQTLHLGGGVPQSFDGDRAVETGFNYYPEIVSVTLAAGGGLTAGAYLYTACYRYVLKSGEIVRSAPAVPFAVTAALNDKGTVAVRTYASGAMCMPSTLIDNVAIEVYRTQVGGQTFTLIETAVLTASNYNDAANPTVAIVDTTSDTTIAGNLPLYTDGTPSPLENLCPPSLYPIVVWNGRLWGIDDSRRRVYYSDEPIEGESPRWHEIQSILIDEGEDLVGFLPSESSMCVGSATKLYRLDGVPANRLGSGTLSYSLLAATAGMASFHHARCEIGTLFQAPSGDIKLLDRGFSVQGIGDAVQVSALASPFMTSALTNGSEREVRMAVQAASGSSTGELLVFDVERKAWMKRQYPSSLALRDTWMVGSTWYFVSSAGLVYKEDTTLYTDGGTFVEMTIGLPWISLGALQGYQRCRLVRVLGDRHTAHDVELSIYHDHSDTATTTRTFSDGTFGTLGLWQLDHSPTRQKDQRFRVQIKTKTPTGGGAVGTGRAASWQAVSFFVEQYEGPGRVQKAVRG